MSEMIVETPLNKRTVIDYDICVGSGLIMPITVDTALGDTFERDLDEIRIHITARPSLHKDGDTIPAEDITIFMRHVFSIQERRREVTDMTPEQKLAWTETVQKMSGAVN